jgi:hypothetical protein
LWIFAGEDSSARERERKEAEAMGIHFVSIPVGGWSAPAVIRSLSFFPLGQDSTKVFVHWRLGEDRTGVFVATYRITRQKWPAERAIKEMYFFGFNGFWHPAMSSYVRKFPNLLAASPALTPLNGSKSSSSVAAGHN